MEAILKCGRPGLVILGVIFRERKRTDDFIAAPSGNCLVAVMHRFGISQSY